MTFAATGGVGSSDVSTAGGLIGDLGTTPKGNAKETQKMTGGPFVPAYFSAMANSGIRYFRMVKPLLFGQKVGDEGTDFGALISGQS